MPTRKSLSLLYFAYYGTFPVLHPTSPQGRPGLPGDAAWAASTPGALAANYVMQQKQLLAELLPEQVSVGRWVWVSGCVLACGRVHGLAHVSVWRTRCRSRLDCVLGNTWCVPGVRIQACSRRCLTLSGDIGQLGDTSARRTRHHVVQQLGPLLDRMRACPEAGSSFTVSYCLCRTG